MFQIFKYHKNPFCCGILLVLDEILSVAQRLWVLKDNFSQANKEQKEELASYFENISNCLGETAKELRAGNMPHDNCGKMLEYAKMFAKKVEGIIEPEMAEEFSKKLVGAYKIEHPLDGFEDVMAKNLLNEIQNPIQSYNPFELMEQASGDFMVLADFIRPA
jgi:hypothetical protein